MTRRTPTCRRTSPTCTSTRGDWDAAEAAIERAEKIDPDNLAARWAEARLLDLRGETDKAVAACKWFVDRYNLRQAEIARDAEALLIVGQAAERYYRATARGEELSDSLNDVINQIYEAALRADPALLAGPLARGPAVPLRLQRGRRGPRAGPGPADQPALARDPRHARPERPAGLQAGLGPGQGRARPWRPTRITPRRSSCWPT